MAFDEPKNLERGPHCLCTISPQRPGFSENDVGLNRARVWVTGIGPVRLLAETLNTFRAVWLRGGREPVKKFESSRSEMRRSRRVN